MSETVHAPARPSWGAIAVSVVAALFYAYAVWNAVGNLLQAAAIGLNATGWVVWVFAALFPVAVFILVAGVAVRWTLWKYAFVHLVGLGVVAVFWFNVVAYSTMYTANLIA
jgi:hypothetical protein